MPDRVGRYRIVRKLGQGGMGVVYAARDEDLDREVAIKTIGEASADDTARRRFRREARAAASVNHPNVCQIYEVGEEGGELFIAMELLTGEPLSERIQRGPLPLPEAVQVGLAILAALDALHGRGLVHRDLKPSNVFLTPHGVKLLDFGLARPLVKPAGETEQRTDTLLSQAGAVVGTPHYIAPEQLQGLAVDGRADLFAVSAILFEMLTGKRPFEGRTMMDVFHAILYEQPPALGGSPAVAAADRVIRRGLSRKPEERQPSASAMAQELRGVLLLEDSGAAPQARPMTRLIVLPFRILRPDPETEFLAFSLPDAITSSLSGLSTLVVRSSLAAARFAGEAPDLRKIAAEAEVDVVLTGSLLRGGEQLRVATQLLEAPGGTVLWSHSTQVTLEDIFQVQDQIVQRIVESLSLSLTAREHSMLKRDVPATAKAYEFYLRANQLGLDSKSWELARQLYLQCLEEDPRYAPAWARLGRVYRVMAKYFRGAPPDTLDRAEAAFKRALDLNPDLTLAHNLYAHFEVEAGRARDAMVRLLERAGKSSADPELFAGLVLTCRYCGLLEASLAADSQARRLDPGVRTSVSYTYWMMGEYERGIATDVDVLSFVRSYSLASLGRRAEALEACAALERAIPQGHGADWAIFMRAGLEGKREECVEASRRIESSGFRDPEGLFMVARALAYVGEQAEALHLLARVVEGGFFCYSTLTRDPWLDPLRAQSDFRAILRTAEARHKEAAAAFLEAGGDRLLGVGAG